jgi:hypothetical protein
MLSNTAISAIRTYVPIGVGLLLTWLASTLKVVIDPSSQAGLVAAATTLLIALYWALARLLEKLNPAFGWLLGSPTQPVYAASGVGVITEPPADLADVDVEPVPAPPAV